MPEGNKIEVTQAPLTSTTEELTRSGLNQVFASHLKDLIDQRSLEADDQENIALPEVNESNHGSLISWCIGAIATGGGIYLETVGQRKVGTAILTLDVLFSFSPIYFGVMKYTGRISEMYKNKRKSTSSGN